MAKERVETKEAPAAIGPYSQAVRAGGWLFLSGQIPLVPKTGQMINGGVPEQTRQVLRNIEAVLRAAGAGMADVVKTTVYMRDLREFARSRLAGCEEFAAMKCLTLMMHHP